MYPTEREGERETGEREREREGGRKKRKGERGRREHLASQFMKYHVVQAHHNQEPAAGTVAAVVEGSHQQPVLHTLWGLQRVLSAVAGHSLLWASLPCLEVADPWVDKVDIVSMIIL